MKSYTSVTYLIFNYNYDKYMCEQKIKFLANSYYKIS